MEEFIAKLNEYLVLAEGALVKAAPQVWDLTLQIIQIQGLVELGCWTLLGVIVALWWTWGLKKLRPALMADDYSGAIPYVVFGAILSLLFVITALVGGVGIILSAFYPEAALVYRVGQQVGIF